MHSRLSAALPLQTLDAFHILESIRSSPNFEKLLHFQQTLKPINTFDIGTSNSLDKESISFEELNLNDEFSSSDLPSMRNLVYRTQERSPRNRLGDTWRQLHGCYDWAGLLDPLDENLRRELVRYGEFAQSAYTAFESNPQVSAEEEEIFPMHVSLPDSSYTVTKSLYSTSAIGVPKWVDGIAPNISQMTQRSSWIGYVAVCDNKKQIKRMGRRDIVIALRGTSTCLEWAENMRAHLVPLGNGKSKVESGFLNLFKSRYGDSQSLSDAVAEEIQRLMKCYAGETLSITITGHSLGAALALLVADKVATCGAPIAVFSFGGPRVGNRAFARRLEKKNVKVLRVVNNDDVITKVPGLPIVGEVPDGLPLCYTHVGTELRVHTKMSPYLKPNADMACCHDLETYLHLVDGFLSSDAPFRADAKRCVMRLFTEHTSNIKQMYISKARHFNNL